MEPLAILSLVLFAALTVAFVAFLRRAGILVAAIRDHQRFQREVAELERRAGDALDPFLARIEEVRHRRAFAEPLAEQLPVTRSVLDDILRRADGLRSPAALADVGPSLVEALTRVDRALRLVEHGADGLAVTRGGPRELESQTSLKRGALALRNARADLATVAARVASAQPPGHAGGARPVAAGVRRTAAPHPSIAPPPASLLRRNDEHDPSM